MSNFAGASRTVVIRTSRETLGLVVAASAMTFALAYSVHSKHDRLPPPAPEAQLPAPQQDWAGHLAELVPTDTPAPSEPMSSAALVVPKSQLALPALPVRLPVKRPCLEPTCAKAATATPTIGPSMASPKHLVAAERAHERSRKTLLGMLNPLNHLPDMTTVGRPFTYAGSTVASWFKRL